MCRVFYSIILYDIMDVDRFFKLPKTYFSKRWKSYPELTRAGNVYLMCRRAILVMVKVDRVYYISVERGKARSQRDFTPFDQKGGHYG